MPQTGLRLMMMMSALGLPDTGGLPAGSRIKTVEKTTHVVLTLRDVENRPGMPS